jgi:hypothetical protein
VCGWVDGWVGEQVSGKDTVREYWCLGCIVVICVVKVSLLPLADARHVELQHMEALVKKLRETHSRETEDLLHTRSMELQHFDEKLRARDEELNGMHLRVCCRGVKLDWFELVAPLIAMNS